jgi:hypothetical protein
VLPFDIEVMQGENIRVPSIVRLARFKPLPFGSREPFYELMPLVILGSESCGVFGDGKIDIIELRRGVQR